MDGLAVARRLTSVFCRSPLNFSTARQRFSFQRLSFSGIYLLFFSLPLFAFRPSQSAFSYFSFLLSLARRSLGEGGYLLL